MKNLILLLAIVTLTNCNTYSTQKIEPQKVVDINAFIASQNFTVTTPETWRPVSHHGSVSYTPLRAGENYFNNLVSIFKYQLEETLPFKEFAMKQIMQTVRKQTLISHKTTEETNRFGTVYIHNYTSTFNNREYRVTAMYFQVDNNYYFYKYGSLKKIYDKHLNEANAILESMSFK